MRGTPGPPSPSWDTGATEKARHPTSQAVKHGTGGVLTGLLKKQEGAALSSEFISGPPRVLEMQALLHPLEQAVSLKSKSGSGQEHISPPHLDFQTCWKAGSIRDWTEGPGLRCPWGAPHCAGLGCQPLASLTQPAVPLLPGWAEGLSFGKGGGGEGTSPGALAAHPAPMAWLLGFGQRPGQEKCWAPGLYQDWKCRWGTAWRGEGGRRNTREDVSVLPLGLYFRMTEFQSISFYWNFKSKHLIVSNPNEVQTCPKSRQNPVPQV